MSLPLLQPGAEAALQATYRDDIGTSMTHALWRYSTAEYTAAALDM